VVLNVNVSAVCLVLRINILEGGCSAIRQRDGEFLISSWAQGTIFIYKVKY